MKKILAVALAATTVLATPAFAQNAPASFTGPRVGVTVGFADEDVGGTEAFTYGANVGYDFDLGAAVVGATLEYQESSEAGLGRDLSAVGRVGAKIGDRALIYGLAGYTNLNIEGTSIDLDGVRVGGGLELAFTPNVFAKAEYRYSNYELDLDGHQMVAGLGFRF